MRGAIGQAGELRSSRVESLRAVAALAVMEGHIFGGSTGYGAGAYATWWDRTRLGGGFGVYLFFTLSGYLLYLPFARRSFGPGRPVDLARYARNRVLRILPLYYAVAITYLLVFHGRPRDWAAYLTFTETLSRETIGRIDGPIWSLVVELLFYALLPLLAAGVAVLARRSIPRAAVLLGGLGAAAAAYRWGAVLHVHRPDVLVQHNLPATFYFFVPGMLLALAKVATENADWNPTGWLGHDGLWLVASGVCWALVFEHYDWDLLIGPGSFLLLAACVLPTRPGRAVRALEWTPLAALGTASYSLYLWHMPIVDALGRHRLGGYPGHLAVGAAVCLAVAAASYRIIEVPFLRLRTRWGDTAAAGDAGAPAGVAAPPRPVPGQVVFRNRRPGLRGTGARGGRLP